MSLKFKRRDRRLETLDDDLPHVDDSRVFTEDEVLHFGGWKQWTLLSEEQRDNMMAQTQSAAYQEWMQEDDWDDSAIEEDLVGYANGKI